MAGPVFVGGLMGLVSGEGRIIGGVLVEIDDPALSFEESAGRVKAIFDQKLGTMWPEHMPKLE